MENLKHGSRKPNVKVNGLVNIYGMKFHDIEGGFGEGKKAMLVKEIAEIHGRELKAINQNINNNISRFKLGVDLLDLKNGHFELPLQELGLTNRDISISKNIYLLSERGYSKLLKILEDDFAWEQYDKLVDGYFNMRGQAKQLSTEEMLELQFRYAKEVKQEVKELKEDLNSFKDNAPLFNVECDDLMDKVKSIATKVLGGYGSPAYKNKSLSSRVYADIQYQIRREFQVRKYKAIKRKDLEKALDILSNYRAPLVLDDEIRQVNNHINFEEVI